MAWLALGVELGLRPALELGSTGIAPSFVVPCAVFVALWAPTHVAAAACLVLGLLVDLTWLAPAPAGGAAVAGPHALGYLLMAQLVGAARSLIIRRNPLTLIVLSAVGSVIVHAVVVALLTIHTLVEPLTWDPTGEIIRRLAASLYTAVSGAAVALVVYPLTPLFGFPHVASGPRFSRRE